MIYIYIYIKKQSIILLVQTFIFILTQFLSDKNILTKIILIWLILFYLLIIEFFLVKSPSEVILINHAVYWYKKNEDNSEFNRQRI